MSSKVHRRGRRVSGQRLHHPLRRAVAGVAQRELRLELRPEGCAKRRRGAAQRPIQRRDGKRQAQPVAGRGLDLEQPLPLAERGATDRRQQLRLQRSWADDLAQQPQQHAHGEFLGQALPRGEPCGRLLREPDPYGGLANPDLQAALTQLHQRPVAVEVGEQLTQLGGADQEQPDLAEGLERHAPGKAHSGALAAEMLQGGVEQQRPPLRLQTGPCGKLQIGDAQRVA
ncbi:MAG: hypothetical protein KatS3mg126_0734 [Lysobacteraceae bacterium]|nr:MAG: hypothetical protein KatS3mg126_0734 [Xanthomonadaceae bacterium]